MTPEKWRLIEELYHSALEVAPEDRTAFLAQACRGDEGLHRTIEHLIAQEPGDRILDQPVADLEAVLAPTELYGEPASTARKSEEESIPRMEGRRIGVYQILREIGHGGMGRVYLASRDDVVHRQVAIKIVRAGLGESDILSRFRQEREILASLDHPAIARFIDAGSTEEGLPYFVMEYIDGEPIDTWCDRLKLNVTERLKLFRAICAGVQYAHQRLIVHRDLKPSNILVTSEGEVKLLDFGIAKLLDKDATPKDEADTETLIARMTPQYASPEQIRGEHVTTASDVYALGVVLYELLTGHRPYRMRSRLIQEVARVICEEEPTRPSAVITEVENAGEAPAVARPETISEIREGSMARLRHRLEGDLDNILLRALEKGPARRYSSADQFSEDVRRHLEGMPVSARRDTVWYRAGKFIRRHQVGSAATVLIVVSVFFALITTLWQTRTAVELLKEAGARAEDTRTPGSAAQGRQTAGQALNRLQLPASGRGQDVLAPEFVLFIFLLWVLLAVTVYFTRANFRRSLGALAAGVTFMLLFIAEETLPELGGLRHFTWTVSSQALPLAYAAIIPYGGAISLIGWRITRRFGWRGQAAFLAAACIGGPMRDYLWITVAALPGVAGTPGFSPWLADGVLWFCVVGSGQAIMRIIAGPSKSDRLTSIRGKV